MHIKISVRWYEMRVPSKGTITSHFSFSCYGYFAKNQSPSMEPHDPGAYL